MRVLHVYKTALPDSIGGIEQVVHTLAQHAQARGVHSEVLALCGDAAQAGTRIHAGYTLHRLQRIAEVASMPVSLGLVRRYAQLARRADLIHYHFPWPFMDALHFAASAGTPSVLTYHSDIVRQRQLLRLYRPLQRRFLRSVDRIVATSPNYLATSPVLAEHRAKVSVIPIGLDAAPQHAASPQRVAAWRARLGPRFLLFVGVLRYYKGVRFLLQAAQGLQIPIAIAGDGPEAAALRAQAQASGLSHVHFLGRVDETDKHALLAACEALVLPSHLRAEAFGISLLEAAMHAKPMISCELGTGTSFVNVDGETGLVVPPADPAALRDAMRYLWDHPPIAAAFGGHAEARYRRLFAADGMVDAYLALYRRICGTRGTADGE
ncbi:glycosyltransferase involved in cell wall biosynthesis [Xanthomonas sacchari]|uniref:glycosyltransferase n=1 Tax=Xanthomonas sacchari TaxID=56458 RepID=UPI0027833C74|nr:glycosyltransferase [Xanthomonas sacchari]MDQ1094837.1 glycosyltransferase involved in cell wall biosynthesis [Xanthomonas sacchari]